MFMSKVIHQHMSGYSQGTEQAGVQGDGRRREQGE